MLSLAVVRAKAFRNRLPRESDSSHYRPPPTILLHAVQLAESYFTRLPLKLIEIKLEWGCRRLNSVPSRSV